MTSRLDRLLLLLDTGSSTSVRTTAAKQLAQLAVKSVISDVNIVEDDIKSTRQHATAVSDSAAWSELMSVVARILPYLHSKSHETRTAVSVALSQIFTLVPLWHPGADEADKIPGEAEGLPAPEFPHFSVQELMERGTLLLASSGKEFTKPTGILASSSEVKKARKDAMSRLGLDFLDTVGDADGIDLEKELADDGDDMPVDDASADGADGVKMEDVKMEEDVKPILQPEPLKIEKAETPQAGPSQSPTPALSPAPSNGPPAPEDTSNLSARERNRLKRKRKGGQSAFVVATAPSTSSKYSASSVAPPNKVRVVGEDRSTPASRAASPKTPVDGERVVVDPSKGGAVSPRAEKQSRALEVEPGRWVWDGLVKMLEVDLFSPAWEVRHGAAMALRELLKNQGRFGGMRAGQAWPENELAHERWCNDLAVKFLCVFALDRFGDFVSDQVVAPVRETVSQTLAALLLHMPRRGALRVHAVLLEMIRQGFPAGPRAQNGAAKTDKGQGQGHVWEVRHAGLLGIKYEVAVRGDLVAADGGKEVLRGVVDAAVLGLGDRDDDVRSVAASCLLPVAEHLVNQLPEELPRVLAVLWSCLSDMKDDLSSSVGAVMELLGKLVAYDQVIGIIADPAQSQPLSTLAPTLFPFFRHTIPGVRLAVVQTLHAFACVPELPKDWLGAPLLQLLFQNLVAEERADVRAATLAAWRVLLAILAAAPGRLPQTVPQALLLQWYSAMMTPLGTPIDVSLFYDPALAKSIEQGTERHNVDKNMIAQDLSLISTETVIAARVAAAEAMAYVMAVWPNLDEKPDEMGHDATFRPILIHYIDSPSMLQKFLAAVITEEWAREYDATAGPGAKLLIERSALARDLAARTLAFLQGEPPASYHEMMYTLQRLHAECYALLHAFAHDCKLPVSAIPSLGTEIDVTATRPHAFTIATAEEAVGPMFDRLRDALGRTKKKELAVLKDKRAAAAANIARYSEVKAQYDVRVSAAFAAAFVALKATPDKVSPIVKGIMNGIKSEENIQLQTRSAVAVAAFVDFCVQRALHQPPEKIVKNLCTFLCQDVEQTPTFAYNRRYARGILSFKTPAPAEKAGAKEDPPSPEAAARARLSRRGASLAFVQLSSKFGERLLDIVPNMWHSMAGGLLSACAGDEAKKMDQLVDTRFGQDVIDSLSVLDAVVPTVHAGLHPKFHELFPMIGLALRSRFAIIRQCAARCFATICDVITVAAMRFVIEKMVPYLGDAPNITNRQGATELIYHIVQKLDIKALPYVIFMVVPVLGRMSDSDDDIRSTATNTFASLVKMVPLEAGLPDPPDFSEDLLRRRETERQFLTQLLDGSKVQQYDIPVKINAELRKYQQEGVNWLAFLAKYQLHGILCDDMGLGKTLQSICILASKHYERAKRFEETQSPDSVHLPSLIVCPPTLTGHWYYEILKYTENLKPILYTGNSRERCKLIPKLKKHDIVITSYEVVRNDVASLQDMSWHYCVLDEGHIIKNAKTKLTKAVKSIRANHRLILSGTPIQNNVLELWSLFDFLMPGFLGTESSFNERFSKPILSNRDGKSKSGEAAALALEALHKQVLPFLLRRLKEDVLNDLPPKIIQDYYCELSDLQKYMYDDFSKSGARSSAEDVVRADGGSGGKGQTHVFQSLQYLRKLCNHPALVLKDPQSVKDTLENAGYKGEATTLSEISHAPKLLALRQLLNDCGIGTSTGLGGESAKSELLETDAGSSGAFSQHRVLIFCQMKQMIDIIENDLFKQHMPSVTYMRLDGSTDANKRHAIVQTFNSDPSIDCLLLTTHVGGLGLTLTGADTVIFVEHDWNPMKDLQAMDRAHRIGQKKVVNVYRLITKGTLEEKIMGLQRFKLNIANSVVTQQNSGLSSMDTDLVLDLFRHTTEEEDAAAAKKKEKDPAAFGQKNVLKGLEDLPPEDEYTGLDLASFMGSLSAR